MKRRIVASIALAPLVAALLAATPAGAASAGWATHGPEGALVSELLIDPQHPATLYAGTESGIFKTTDGGGGWHRLSGFPAVDVNALAIAQSDPDVLYAAAVDRAGPDVFPVYRSLDAGATWQRVIADAELDRDVTYPQPRQRIAIDPTDPDIVYIATLDGGILRSTDGGRHWQPAGSGFGTTQFRTDVLNIAIDTRRPRTLLAATTTGLWRSRNGAESWLQVAPLPKFRDIAAIAFDPSDQRVAYAGGDRGLFRSADAGDTWSRVGDLPVGPGFQVVEIAIAASDPDVFYIADSGRIYRSRDGAESWKPTAHGFGPTNLSLAVDPSDPSRLYAGTDNGADVLKSVDGARTWHDVNGGLTALRVSWVLADPSRPDVVYAGTGAIQKSEDGGSTWSDLHRPAEALGIDPANPDLLYAGSNGRISRSNDGGLHWTFLHALPGDGVTPNHISSLIVSTKDPNTVYAGVYRDGLFRSVDGGLHWTPMPVGFQDELVVDMAMNPVHPRTLYLALARRGTYKSRDGGHTWREVLPVPSVTSIEIDPTDPERVYAGFTNAEGFFATDDRGRTWNQRVRGFPQRGTVGSIAVDPSQHANIYVGMNQGVFESTDFGDHWQPFNAGLVVPDVNDLSFAAEGSVLHAATNGGGVFERDV